MAWKIFLTTLSLTEIEFQVRLRYGKCGLHRVFLRARVQRVWIVSRPRHRM